MKLRSCYAECWLLLLNFLQMAPLYKIALLNLVLRDTFTYTGVNVCKKHKIIFAIFYIIEKKCTVAPFILAHPVFLVTGANDHWLLLLRHIPGKMFRAKYWMTISRIAWAFSRISLFSDTCKIPASSAKFRKLWNMKDNERERKLTSSLFFKLWRSYIIWNSLSYNCRSAEFFQPFEAYLN